MSLVWFFHSVGHLASRWGRQGREVEGSLASPGCHFSFTSFSRLPFSSLNFPFLLPFGHLRDHRERLSQNVAVHGGPCFWDACGERARSVGTQGKVRGGGSEPWTQVRGWVFNPPKCTRRERTRPLAWATRRNPRGRLSKIRVGCYENRSRKEAAHLRERLLHWIAFVRVNRFDLPPPLSPFLF